MSQAGFYLSARARWGYKFLLGTGESLVDILLHDGLTDPIRDEPMGIQTERLVAEHGIARDELDAIAAASHLRAYEAATRGAFDDEIMPVTVKSRKEDHQVRVDEGVRPDASTESLGALRPAFTAGGVLTAGNSSQISDGASALLLASSAAVTSHGLHPIARLMHGAWAAGETWRFPEAPIPAVQNLLERSGLGIEDFDLFENNEAFAVNNVLFNRMLGVDLEILNVHGGAIALGHPIGASGARIVTTLIHALATHNRERGLAAICHGTGGGTALAVERA